MYFILFIILLITWIALFPMQALDLVIKLKRRIRDNIIQHSGHRDAQELSRQLHGWAHQNGIDSEIVDEVLNENWEEMCCKLGSAAANASLGEPTAIEE